MPVADRAGAGRPLRIAFLVYNFPKISETFVINQAAGLLERGHQVDIYALGGPLAYATMHDSVRRYGLDARTCHLVPPKRDLGQVLRWSGSCLAQAGRAPRLPARYARHRRLGRHVSLPRLLSLAGRLAGRPSYDLMHCQFDTLGFYPVSASYGPCTRLDNASRLYSHYMDL